MSPFKEFLYLLLEMEIGCSKRFLSLGMVYSTRYKARLLSSLTIPSFYLHDLPERFDKGVESTDASGAGYVEETAPPPRENGDQDANALVDSMLRLEFEAPDAFASARSKVPSMSDMLIAYATVPGESSCCLQTFGFFFLIF